MADFTFLAQVYLKEIDNSGNVIRTVAQPAAIVTGQPFVEYEGADSGAPNGYNLFTLAGDGSSRVALNDNATDNPQIGGYGVNGGTGGLFFACYQTYFATGGFIPDWPGFAPYPFQPEGGVRLSVSGFVFPDARVDGQPDPVSIPSTYFAGGNSSIVLLSDAYYKYTVQVQFAPTPIGSPKATYWLSSATFQPYQSFFTITITRQQLQKLTTSQVQGSQAGYFPNIRLALSTATGGGNHRLMLASVRTYAELTYSAVNSSAGEILSGSATASYTSSAVNVTTSTDFGETFDPGVDIQAASYSDQALFSEGRTETSTSDLAGPGTFVPDYPVNPLTGPTSYPQPAVCLPAITSLLVTPHGRIIVNGTHKGTASILDWQSARVTDNVLGKAGWRNANTQNQGLIKVGQAAGVGIGFPSGTVASWLTAGAYQGTKGGGGKSGGPSSLRAGPSSLAAQSPLSPTDQTVAYWYSDDAGDTWTQEVPPNPPASGLPAGAKWFLQNPPRGATTDDVIYQKGQAFDFKNFSSTGFEGWDYFWGIPAGLSGEPPGQLIPMVSAPVPWNIAAKVRSGEGEIVRAIVQDPNNPTTGLALTSARYGFGTGFVMPNPTIAPNAFLRVNNAVGLPTGTYKVGYTWKTSNAYGQPGETLISPLEEVEITGPSQAIQTNAMPLPAAQIALGQINVYMSTGPGSSTLGLADTIPGGTPGLGLIISSVPPNGAVQPPATNTTGPTVAQPSGTTLYQGTYWDTPATIQVSATGDGANLSPFLIKCPQWSGHCLAAAAWMQRIVLIVAIDDTIAVLVTENEGQYWRYSVYSTSNGQKWIPGKPTNW